MILVRAPLRLSFFGGGSDLPVFYENSLTGGATLSASFDTFMYVALMRTPTPHVKVSYSKTEYAECAEDVQHDVIRELLLYHGIRNQIELTTFADIPTVGTGLGASSAIAVATALGLMVFNRETPDIVASIRIASRIEQNLHSIGWQDHIATGTGGMVYATYSSRDLPTVTRVHYDALGLFTRLVLVKAPDRQMSAGETLRKFPMNRFAVADLVAIATEGRTAATLGDWKRFGYLLNESWYIKKSSSSAITTPTIDSLYAFGLEHGAIAGKLLGAGGGGYMLFMAETPDTADDLARRMTAEGSAVIRPYPTVDGAKVVFSDHE